MAAWDFRTDEENEAVAVRQAQSAGADAVRAKESLRLALERCEALAAERDALCDALTKINVVCDSIIGAQGFNWSEHAYQLVAALNATGFRGADYKQVLDRMIQNDARNIRDTVNIADYRAHQLIASDCAARMVDVWDFGDGELIQRASFNLRDAVLQLPTHRVALPGKVHSE